MGNMYLDLVGESGCECGVVVTHANFDIAEL